MEWVTFGPFLARTRFAFLNQLASSRRALILGDGDGRFTARLLRANPGIHIDAVDASPAMLQALICRAGPHAARVRTRCADARHFQPPSPPYDLIVTHFFLDCLTTSEIQSLAATLHAATAPQALWLVSEFVVPPTLFGRLIAQPIIYALYRAFALLTGLSVRTLPNHHAALRLAGFTLKAQLPRLAGLLVSELWAAHSNHGSQRAN
jgi:SAM-dependent methyltransferase